MTYTIAMVTTDPAGLGGRDQDTGPLADALRAVGLTVDAPVWHDPAVDWAGYDLVVIRTPWDYSERYPEFLAWLDRAAGLTRVLNAPELIRWNIDKRYLDDFQALGVPVVPTVFCVTADEVRAAVAGFATGRVVLKPSVSAGSRDTGLFEPGDPRALDLAGRILADGKTVMVQPAAERVIEDGENALFFFNGEYSHAFHKGPILVPGGGYVGGSYTSDISRVEPHADEIVLGARVLAAVRTIAAAKGLGADAGLPLYARVDIAAGLPPEVIEVEIFEPAYFVDVVPEAVPAFVRAVQERLAR
ncbi:RimK family alpha-L-glutamate ligase [Actinoplanes sp. NPDC051494]|uniref:RimK family alpha-L-glutamate ligase n=1 Tax=Actinoplanes sp. NPDC051494 TaxID=3363907 RepID=UPI00379963F9